MAEVNTSQRLLVDHSLHSLIPLQFFLVQEEVDRIRQKYAQHNENELPLPIFYLLSPQFSSRFGSTERLYTVLDGHELLYVQHEQGKISATGRIYDHQPLNIKTLEQRILQVQVHGIHEIGDYKDCMLPKQTYARWLRRQEVFHGFHVGSNGVAPHFTGRVFLDS